MSASEPEAGSRTEPAAHRGVEPPIAPDEELDRESFAARRVMPPALVAMLAVLAGCGPRGEG